MWALQRYSSPTIEYLDYHDFSDIADGLAVIVGCDSRYHIFSQTGGECYHVLILVLVDQLPQN